MSKWQNRITRYGEEAPDQLMANPQNHRIHPKHQQQVMAGALDEIGWIQDVIVNEQTGHIVDGHLRVELALREDETAVPVKYVNLSPDDERKALASLDPIGALAEQDQEALDNLIDSTGETNNEDLAEFLASLHSPDPEDDEPEEGETDPDDIPDARDSYTSKPGDVWIMGEHRLMVGDSLDVTNIEHLCQGSPVEMVWTDPPYNVDYEGKTKEALKIDNDQMSDSDFRQFLIDAYASALAWTIEGGPIYVAHADSEGANFRMAMVDAGWLLKQCLIWAKNTMVLGRQDYQWQHEPILYGWKPGAAHRWYGEFNKKTLIDQMPDVKAMDKSDMVNHIRHLRNALNASIVRFDKPSRSEDHPTTKPVELVAHCIRNSSRKGDRVLDIFAGSGSTVIACQQYGRAARVMENDRRYADVIVRRWEKFTGQDAILESTGQAFAEVTPSEAPEPVANA